MLRKDGLIDENAPEEQKTAEEMADILNNQVRALQTRLRLLFDLVQKINKTLILQIQGHSISGVQANCNSPPFQDGPSDSRAHEY